MELRTTGIDHLNLEVIDLEESCAFWRDLLGFETLEEISDQHGKIIGNRQAKLALYQTEGMKSYEKLGFSHMCFHIENFDDIEEKCKDLGIEVKFDGVVKWPKSRSIYIDDPNGYEIELTEVWGGGLDEQ